MGSYKLSPSAEDDLFRIYRWGVQQFGEAAADKYYFAFFERFEALAEQPYLYQGTDEIRQGYRKSICGADTIYYRISDNNDVEIMGILGRQDPERWL